MTEVPHWSFIQFAERYINERANIEPTLAELRERPELFDSLVKELNVAVVALDNFLQVETMSSQDQQTLLNTKITRDTLVRDKLPTLLAIEQDASLGTLRTGVETFKFADELMRKGELGSSEPKWEFHKQMNGELLAAALMLEIYGRFIERKFPQVADLEKGGFTIVLALEEMIGWYHEAMPHFFEAVNGWYSEDEGFSKELIEHTQRILSKKVEPNERGEFRGTVRPVQTSDLSSLKPILETWIHDRQTGTLIPEEVREVLGHIGNAAFRRGDRRYLVAQDVDGSVIGVIGYLPPTKSMQQFAMTNRPVEMVNLYVAQEHRSGRGVGLALFQGLEQQIRSEGYTEVIWNSGPRYLKTAWKFYNNLPKVVQAGVAERLYGNNDAMVWRQVLV